MRNICNIFRVKHKKWIKVEKNGKDYRKEEIMKEISDANSSPAWKTESWNIIEFIEKKNILQQSI